MLKNKFVATFGTKRRPINMVVLFSHIFFCVCHLVSQKKSSSSHWLFPLFLLSLKAIFSASCFAIYFFSVTKSADIKIHATTNIPGTGRRRRWNDDVDHNHTYPLLFWIHIKNITAFFSHSSLPSFLFLFIFCCCCCFFLATVFFFSLSSSFF